MPDERPRPIRRYDCVQPDDPPAACPECRAYLGVPLPGSYVVDVLHLRPGQRMHRTVSDIYVLPCPRCGLHVLFDVPP